MKTSQPKTKKQKKVVSNKEDKTSFDGTFEQLIDIVAPPIKPKTNGYKSKPNKTA